MAERRMLQAASASCVHGCRKAMRNIATGFDTGEWPAPITADYTDELNDFDLRRLEALRTQA
ncbi:hypothetical protein WJY36_003570 [Escherichia coli]